jgi:hypothetical protein
VGRPARIFFGFCAASVAVASIAFVDPSATQYPGQAAAWLAGQLHDSTPPSPSSVPGLVTLPPTASLTPVIATPPPTPSPGTIPCPNPATNILCDGGNPANLEPTPPALITPPPAVDQYGWDISAPYPVAAAMPELTALQALQTNPPLAQSALITVTTAPANGLWTAAQCNWALDTMSADYELDRGAAIKYLGNLGLGTSHFYYYASDDWNMAIGDAESECWHNTAADPSYAESDINNFRMAEGTHAPRVAQYGPSDTWDVSWADAYLELEQLYQKFDPNHVGCATCL